MKKRIVALNWKLYIETETDAKKLLAALKRARAKFSNTDTVVCPPFPLIPAAASALKGTPLGVGAQTLSPYKGGARTGEVSAGLLKNAGASWVIVGHSEQRAMGLTNEQVAEQIARALEAKLKIILCVGEREREQTGVHFTYIAEQLTSAFGGATVPGNIVIAYEPVWAIGKSAAEAMSPADLRETMIFIRRTLSERFNRAAALKIPILYGGSVDSTNAQQLLDEGGVNGFLVGRASADQDEFLDILSICSKK